MKVENLFPELKIFIDNPEAYTVLYFKVVLKSMLKEVIKENEIS